MEIANESLNKWWAKSSTDRLLKS